MFLSKLFKSKTSKWLTALGAFAMVMGIGAAASSVAHVSANSSETTFAEATNNTSRIYFQFGDNGGPYGIDFDPTIWDFQGTQSGNTYVAVPKIGYNGFTVDTPSYAKVEYRTTQYSYVFDTQNTSKSGLKLKFQQWDGGWGRNVQWYPNWNGTYNNQKDGIVGDATFAAGTIYTLGIYYTASYDVKWFGWDQQVVGYFINYDYAYGHAASGTKPHQESFGDSTTVQAAPTRYGFSFAGWKRSDTNEVISAGSQISGLSSSITLTAQWEIQTISDSKARIWIGYDTSSPYHGSGAVIRLWIHSTEAGGSEKLYDSDDENVCFTYYNGSQSNRRYDFFDIDLAHYTNGWYVNIQRIDPSNRSTVWNQTKPIQLLQGNAAKVIYTPSPSGQADTASIGSVGSGTNCVDAGMAAFAICGLRTCSNNNFNGYGAFLNMQSTFILDGETWRTSGDLSSIAIADYAEGDTSYRGSTTNHINAYQKYQGLANIVDHGNPNPTFVIPGMPSGQESPLTVTLWVVLASGIAGLAAIGSAYFVSKKKKKNRA